VRRGKAGGEEEEEEDGELLQRVGDEEA